MQPNIKITLYTVIAVFVGFLVVGTPYTQYYSVGQAYIVEGKSADGELNYSPITADEYELDPLNENPKVITRVSHREDVPNKVFYPERAYRIELWSTDPNSNYGNWLPSGSYVVQDMGTKNEADDVYMVCHSGKDCRGNKNLEYYLQGETPDLRANLQASLIETAYAAIVNESTGQSSLTPAASVSSQSFSYTSPSISNPTLVLCAGTYDGGASADLPITSVTYGGDSLSLLGRAEVTDSNTSASEQWYTQNFTTGSSTMVINYTGVIQYGLGFNSTYSGVSTSTPIDTVATETITNDADWTPSITATSSNAMISDCKTMTRSLFDANDAEPQAPAVSKGSLSFIALNWELANTQASTTATSNRWLCIEDANCAASDWTSVLVALTTSDFIVPTSTPSVISDFIMFE